MSLPSKTKQIEAVAKFLDSDKTEGKDLDKVAKEIVDGYHEALMAGIKKPAQPLRVGMLFKTPMTGRVERVTWTDGQTVWFVSDNSSYGYLGSLGDLFWQYAEEYRPKRRTEGKLVEMTDEEIAEQWDNPDWKVGDRVSQHQREHMFEIIAVGPACALMLNGKGGLVSDSNTNMDRYYRREIAVKEVEW